MTHRIAVLAALAMAALPVSAQTATCTTATVPICSQPVGVNPVQIKPQAVPTSAATVTTVDAYLSSVTVANPTGGAITVTICDRQGSPICPIGAVSVAANTTYVISFPGGYWCPGGFTVVASGSGLTWYGAWRQ